MRVVATLLMLGVQFTSCEKSEPETVPSDSLTGVWVEKTARKDTLIFYLANKPSIRQEGFLTVNRGRETNAGGYTVPKLGSGFYQYYLEDKTINVYNLYSSSFQCTKYALEQQGEELLIENFFELGFNKPATAVRTLVRL